MAEHPDAERWAYRSLDEFRKLAAAETPGVAMVHGLEASREPARYHPWLDATGRVEVVADPARLPAGYASGWRYETAVLDMPVYSQFLHERLTEAEGVQVRAGYVRSLRDLIGQAAVVVNCSGGGARRLARDDSVTPMRGQLLVVRNPGIDEFYAEVGDGPELTYFIPHGDHVVLGSTLEPPGPAGRGGWLPDTAERIRRRCGAIEPALATAELIDSRVGYRPVRPVIRVEPSDVDGHPVIHYYGQGGGGVSVSWGCAYEVLSMVSELL